MIALPKDIEVLENLRIWNNNILDPEKDNKQGMTEIYCLHAFKKEVREVWFDHFDSIDELNFIEYLFAFTIKSCILARIFTAVPSLHVSLGVNEEERSCQ